MRHRLCQEVLEGMGRWHTEADRARARRYFFGSSAPIEAAEAEIDSFLQWYVHDFRDSGRKTLMERYWDAHHTELTPLERKVLSALRESWPGVFETVSVEEGRGLHLKDVTSSQEFFLHDVTASRELAPGAWLLSRIEESDGTFHFVSDGTVIPPAVREAFLAFLASEAISSRQTTTELVRSLGNRLCAVIRRLSQEWVKNLRMVNREGDALEFCHSDYAVLDEAALLAVLRALEELREEAGAPGAVRFGWLGPAEGDSRHVYGHVAVAGGKLRLEAQSRTRLMLGRSLLEAHAARLLKHEGDVCLTQEEWKAQAMTAGAARNEDRPGEAALPVPNEEERQVILEIKARHYSTWPDDPLPALGGRTARHAVKTKAGRQAVISLLREMEQDEARAAKRGDPAFDFGIIRQALGLPTE